MNTTYYIDGYNVVHKMVMPNTLRPENLESARDKLIEIAASLCSATGENAIVFFDGRGRVSEMRTHEVPHVKIVYSPTRKTADALIERAVHEKENRKEIVVVTADRGIADLCRGMGAMIMTPEHFLLVAEESADRLSRRIQRTHGSGRSASIEEQLTESEREHLMHIKKILNERGKNEGPGSEN